MQQKEPIFSSLSGRLVALPESRQLDVLSELYARRGAEVLRVPLVAIKDAPDQTPVTNWLRGLVTDPPEYLIILTGEGLRRLLSAAERLGMRDQFIAALERTLKICRGPKPGRALKEIGLKPDLLGAAPTSAGIIQTLETLTLADKRIAVQLYGEDPNRLLMDYVASRNPAGILPVSPYIYATDSDTGSVAALIARMATGEVDLIAFTSQPQVKRLLAVAAEQNLESELKQGMARTRIAAVGPVVRDMLQALGYQVAIMPAESFFMKPLVTASEQLFTNE